MNIANETSKLWRTAMLSLFLDAKWIWMIWIRRDLKWPHDLLLLHVLLLLRHLLCCVLPIQKAVFPETSPAWCWAQMGPSMGPLEPDGAIWNCLCPAWGSPGLCPWGAPSQHLGTGTLWTCSDWDTCEAIDIPTERLSANFIWCYYQFTAWEWFIWCNWDTHLSLNWTTFGRWAWNSEFRLNFT